MNDLTHSQSEVFFYGALAFALDPLTEHARNDSDPLDRVMRWFPTIRDAQMVQVDPFPAFEQLAVEFGIARRAELEAAGDDEELPLSPEFRSATPDDIEWTFADGTPASAEDIEDLVTSLSERASAYLTDISQHADDMALVQKLMLHPSNMLDSMSGLPQWVTTGVSQHFYKLYAESLGSYVAEGVALSEPGHLYRLTWLGDIHRYGVVQQDHPLYVSLVRRFHDELKPPRFVMLSLMKAWNRHCTSDKDAVRKEPGDSPQTSRVAGNIRTRQLSLWLHDMAKSLGESAPWNLAYHLSFAKAASQALERHVARHEPHFADMQAKHESLRLMSTRERLADFFEYAPHIVDERVAAFKNSGRDYDEPSPEDVPLLGARYLCQRVRDSMWHAREWAKELGLTEVATMTDGGGVSCQQLDHSFKALALGSTALEDIRNGIRLLAGTASDALKLAYGQLYFRELTENSVYIDVTTKAALLRQPRAIREQLAEAISQFERQTFPNCTVTSVCGLIEPIVREIASQWIPQDNYGGDVAEVLSGLRRHLATKKKALREQQKDGGTPSTEEVEILMKLYCVDLAFALHMLGNTVRHHSDKVLKRHDAGVMLHGICALLHRIGG